MTRIIIEVYIVFSAFLIGQMFEEFMDDYKGWRRVLAVALYAILLPIQKLFEAIKWVLYKIEVYTAITFWLKFYLTKSWDNLSIGQLRTQHNICKNHRNTNSLRHRYWRFCVKKIFERNNYNPETDLNNQDL